MGEDLTPAEKKNHFGKSLRLAYRRSLNAWNDRSDIPGGCFTVAKDLAKQALKAAEISLNTKQGSTTSDEASLLASHMAEQANRIGRSFGCDAWDAFAKICGKLV